MPTNCPDVTVLSCPRSRSDGGTPSSRPPKPSCERGPSDPKRTVPERFKPHPSQVKGETACPHAARQACRGPSAARRARERAHVPAPVASRPSVTGRTVCGRTRSWRVGPLWRRGIADRPEERGRDGVRRSDNGRRRGMGVYKAWHLGASLSLFKIYN